MTGYVSKEKLAAKRIYHWLTQEEPEPYTIFCRKARIAHGIRRSTMDRILGEDYPSVRIVDDRVVTQGE